MLSMGMILLLALADDKETEDALQKFKAAMKSPDLSLRVAAVADLGRLQNVRVLKVLAACLVTDDKQVRMAAAKALGAFPEKKSQTVAVLSEGLDPNVKDPDVQVEILSALHTLHDDSALATAYRHLDDKNAKVAEAAIGITGAVHSRASIDPLIRLMKKLLTAGEGVSSGDGSFDVPPDEALRDRARKLEAAAAKALQAITGEKWSTAQEWGAWWKSNSGSFKVKE
ncbi:MAG TPA: HEAT repeat domain-containing protein [Planctomycetota bacterium]|nr:HEAT repeat domain-containing protein [Planctomycetota bacterium]